VGIGHRPKTTSSNANQEFREWLLSGGFAPAGGHGNDFFVKTGCPEAAMGITTEITEDIFRAGEGRFGVDDPVLLIEWVEELAPGAGLAQCGGAAC